MLTHDAAMEWMARWDRQQEGYLPDREERFTVLIDAVEALGRPDPVVIDLGCGPGSLSARLLERLPEAQVVCVDADPLLIGLGRAAYPGLRFVSADLRRARWTESLELDRPADAAVSTTALHWISGPELKGVYAELATVLRPGGLLLNGDHMDTDDATPTLSRLEHAVHDRETERAFGESRPEDWRAWWDAIEADPALSELNEARSTAGADHRGSESRLLSDHVQALEEAGFTEIGTLWQRGNNRLLCGVRG
ncbi:class I SAM-dependent methyltransferase [Nonomuraea sp. KC401]|uniref:class I SAM-dependent methyltransferase n=1 Tax=unclassified Nonomuraea TaxID=2593643 RepID=UPI0010FE4C29|nr:MULTISPECIES: class I SAM-dependent methyltransferase [unclassified Nonomuraea]NBE94582.1 methyltransferase domain-containing protein [Nonomuraea sp. K271]TLF72672.1 class I SAM-dependent methyltransferase [Nonomuraea sp. KC401]